MYIQFSYSNKQKKKKKITGDSYRKVFENKINALFLPSLVSTQCYGLTPSKRRRDT